MIWDPMASILPGDKNWASQVSEEASWIGAAVGFRSVLIVSMEVI